MGRIKRLGTFFWGTVFCLKSLAGYGAILQCQLLLENQLLDEKSHPVNIEGQPETFVFDMDLKGDLSKATLKWRGGLAWIDLYYEGKGEPLGTFRSWTEPLEDRFFVKRKISIDSIGRELQLACEILISDGKSWNWTLFKLELDHHFFNLESKLGALERKISQDEWSLCLAIGEITGGNDLKNLGIKIANLARNSAKTSRFKKIDDLYFDRIEGGLLHKILGIGNFCQENFTSYPLPKGNKNSLSRTVTLAKQEIKNLKAYIESEFPN